MSAKAFKPTRLELEMLEALWRLGTASIREIQGSLPEDERPEFTTVQTIIYRLEQKGAVERVKRIGNANIFRAIVTRKSAIGSLVDDFLGHFAGSHEPILTHLAESGRISAAELKQIEKLIRERKTK